MLVLAAVRPELAVRLQRAARHRFEFHVVNTWESAVDAILRQPLEIAVADPGLSGEVRAQEIERIKVLFPSLPLILYTTLCPDLATILLRLGQVGIRQVAIAQHDDHPNRLRELLVAETAHAASHKLIDAMGDLLAESCTNPT